MANTKLKRAARARQRRTGERYTEALARVQEELGMTPDDPKPQATSIETFEDALAAAERIFQEGEAKARAYLEANFPSFKEPVNSYARIWSAGDLPSWAKNNPAYERLPDINITWAGKWLLTATAEVQPEARVSGNDPYMTVTFDVYPDSLREEGHNLLETLVRLHLNVRGISWFPAPEFAAYLMDDKLRYTRSVPRVWHGHPINLAPSQVVHYYDSKKPSEYALMAGAWPNRDQYFTNDFFGYQARQQKEREEWDSRRGHLGRTEAVDPVGIYRDEPRPEDQAIFEDMYTPRTVVKNRKLPSGEGQWQESLGMPEPGPIVDKRNDPESIYYTPPDLPTWENPTTYLTD